MRIKILGSVLLIAVSSFLAGCDLTISIGGTVTGLTSPGLVLQNNGGDDLVIDGNGTFKFATPVAPYSPYALTIKTQPSWSTCTVVKGSGTTGPALSTVISIAADQTDISKIGANTANDVTDLSVTCVPNGYAPYALSLLAGGLAASGSTDGTGADARFGQFLDSTGRRSPSGVARDAEGNLYVPDTANFTIRKVTPAGVVTTLAGLAGTPGSVDGSGAEARFVAPDGIAVDAVGNLYVTDWCSVRKITPAGVVTTLAGAGSPGSADGPGADARFAYPDGPRGVAVDHAGNVYVADTGNNTIRKISAAGMVTTLAGTPTSSLASYGAHADGLGAAASFYHPIGIAVDSAGNLYVADRGNHLIRKIDPLGWVSTLAGSTQRCYLLGLGDAHLYFRLCGNGLADGKGASARFDNPVGITVDSTGNLYVADSGNQAIRKITPAGVVSTIIGSSPTASSAVQLGPFPAFLGQQTVGVAASDDKLFIVSDNVVLWAPKL